jgi:hypothetical protein
VVRTGDTVSVDNDQKVEGDFYTAASVINISGEITEDMYAVGGEVTLNGVVAKDVTIAGGRVDVHGSVGDDLRIFGGNVVLAKPVTGDVFVFAGKVSILSTASIGGDLLVYGGDVEISGPVGGDVIGQVETLRVDAPIAGAVNVTVGEMIVGERSAISGTVQYISEKELVRSPNAVISGDVTRNDPAVESPKMNPKMVLIPVLIILFSSLAWFLVARSYLLIVVDRALSHLLRSMVVGGVVLFATPIVTAILMVSVLGTLVGIASFFAYLLLLVLALISSVVVVGQFVMDQLGKKEKRTLTPLTLILGVFVVSLVSFVPIVGPLALILLFITTLGALVDVLLRPKSA